MRWDYGFGELENELIEAGKEFPPNFARMREILAAGANINATSGEKKPDESILSTIIEGYPNDFDRPVACETCERDWYNPCADCPENYWEHYNGSPLPDICKFFIQNGFDIHGGNDTWGGCCIKKLTWSSYDSYILDATKVLLHAGANPNYESDHETLLSWVATKASASLCVDEDINEENLFEAMYSILEAASENRDFDAIEYFEAAVGRQVERIEMYCVPEQELVFTMDEPEFCCNHCFNGTLVFWCGGKALRINDYPDIMVDPYVTLDSSKIKYDMSSYFGDFSEHVLTKVDFNHENTRKGSINYNRSVINLHFSNGKCIRISSNYGKVPKEKYAAYFEVC